MIKTEQLTKKFGSLSAVNNLNLEVAEGEIFGFLGPNGAGKTTTIRMLCGLISPTLGKAWVSGFQLGPENEKVRASIGLLTESPGLYEQLSAWDNMLFYAELYNLTPVLAKKRVQELMVWLDLWPRRNDPVGTYSKGMKQKLAVGRALIHNPQVLFLDEPTAGLDAESARTVRATILTLKGNKRTVFLSTHNLDEAERLCDRIAIFKTELIKVDTPSNLRQHFGSDSRLVSIRVRNKEQGNLLEQVRALTFVKDVKVAMQVESEDSGLVLDITLDDPLNQNPQLINTLVNNGADIQFVEEKTASLEDVYLDLTNKGKNGR